MEVINQDSLVHGRKIYGLLDGKKKTSLIFHKCMFMLVVFDDVCFHALNNIILAFYSVQCSVEVKDSG